MATRKILFRGQTRRKGEKTSISGKPLPGIWVTGGIFPQNKGYERAIIYTQDPKVEKHVVYAETVGQYTGVDDVLETPVFEDDIITFWQRTDTKHLQRYKGIVKYDEALTSFTVVSCEPNRLSDPPFSFGIAPIFMWLETLSTVNSASVSRKFRVLTRNALHWQRTLIRFNFATVLILAL